ncbi:unnamed protein product [Durusdinium trenchii]|uniref:Alpha-galactosidase n=2 Tax=Durusdinium trenchii TaxID=1381693 RepID=A0ABP0SBG9_9DINO
MATARTRAPLAPLLTALVALPAFGLDNGLARVPQMGYNSWYDLECSDAMNESTLRRIADRLVESGLKDLGYQYLNLDDCWAKSRRGDGTLVADEAKFPDGTLKPLADYVHSKGLLLGTYTDRGEQTCAGRPGAARHEELDAKTYAAWGIDYLKEDSCNASGDHLTAFMEYGKMRDALNATGRPVLFSLCGWKSWYAPMGSTLGNSWRIGPDDNNWQGVLQNIDIMNGLETYAGPGGWNDPCLLLSKKTTGEAIMTELQTRAQFSMWAVLAAPLLISGSVLNMSAETLATYSNKEVIQVSQDPLGRQGRRVLGGPVAEGTGNVFARPLADGSFALVFLNSGKEELNVTCGKECFGTLGLSAPLAARDLWAQQRLPDLQDLSFTALLPPAGGHRFLRVRKSADQMTWI